jgi:hypothetical protein
LLQGEIIADGFWGHEYPLERLAVCAKYVACGAQKRVKVWQERQGGMYQQYIQKFSSQHIGDDLQP